LEIVISNTSRKVVGATSSEAYSSGTVFDTVNIKFAVGHSSVMTTLYNE